MKTGFWVLQLDHEAKSSFTPLESLAIKARLLLDDVQSLVPVLSVPQIPSPPIHTPVPILNVPV